MVVNICAKKTYPEEDEDLFHLLHNDTDPRPVRFKDVEEVMGMCYARFDRFLLFLLSDAILLKHTFLLQEMGANNKEGWTVNVSLTLTPTKARKTKITFHKVKLKLLFYILPFQSLEVFEVYKKFNPSWQNSVQPWYEFQVTLSISHTGPSFT